MSYDQSNYGTAWVGGKRIDMTPLSKEQTRSMDSFDNKNRLNQNKYLNRMIRNGNSRA